MQWQTPFPVTLQEWERVLTKALLRADDGNADPIRSFEITPERLAYFCGYGPDRASEAEGAFRRALVSDPHLTWCLQHGTYRSPGTEKPECMAMLALSLLVDSLLDGDYTGTGEYRSKLRQWLGIDRRFTVLRGIAIMWDELVAWLDARVADGAPFRRLVLPVIPASWTHIGYTRYLSFPTRRDLRFLEKQIRRSPQLASDPVGLVRLLDTEIGSPGVSVGLKSAFADFRVALRSGRASVDHRFWRIVEQAKFDRGEVVPPLVDLRMEFDEDGRRQYRLGSPGTIDALPGDIGAAVKATSLLGSPNLGPSARRGVLFFKSSGLASWIATGEPPVGNGRYHVAVAMRHERLARGAVAEFAPSGDWLVTNTAVSSGTVTDILKRLGIRNARENLRSFGLVDGVHVGTSWLGCASLLPRLDGVSGPVQVRRLDEASDVGLRCIDGVIVADATVVGRYTFGDTDGGWSRHAAFVAAAEIHSDLSGSAYSKPLHSEWDSVGPMRAAMAREFDAHWDERPYEYQDVLEGLYASARSGIGEGDAIGLIDRVVGARGWGLLRSLVEATFLDERLRQRWRGKTYTLGPPRLEGVQVGGADAVIVSGAVPSRMEADFRTTVALQGGKSFRRGTSHLVPPVIGATDIDARALAAALGWSFETVSSRPDGTIGESLAETSVIGESYLVGSAWDWNLTRFRADGEAGGPPALTRLMHPGGRDHDLYRVVGKRTRTFTSRNAAILDAHAQASRSMFTIADGQIRRTSREGSLPIEIARALRLTNVSNGGLSADGWQYAVDEQAVPWLASMMPGIIAGIAANPGSDADAWRRGRGARRPLWIDGRLAA